MLLSAAVLAFAAAGIMACSGRIYPNVSVGGIALGGMSEAEAERTLNASHIGAYNGTSVTLDFTDGENVLASLDIFAADIGLERDCGALAHAAVMYGKRGGFFASALDYMRCFFSRTELDGAETPLPDTDRLRALVVGFAAGVDAPPVPDSVTPGESELIFTRGTPGRRIDAGRAVRAAAEAFEQMRFGSVSVALELTYPEPTDPGELYGMIHTEPQDAYFDERFSIIPERCGTEPGADLTAVTADTPYGETVSVPILAVKPAVCASDLEEMLYGTLLSSATTDLTDNEVRSNNIALAAAAIDGTVLLPGEVFSYNDALGMRTVEKGYGAATAYSDGMLVQAVGGGICQVSSTLYYCCLLADLEIVYRTGHAYYQTYVPYGMDATVSWGAPDYRFCNSTEYPLKIAARREGQTVTVELWGTKTDGGYVEMEYIIDEYVPHSVSYVEDASVSPGRQVIADYGRDGMTVSTYRCRYSGDGTLIERVPEAVSRYRSRSRSVHVAPGELP